LAYLIPGKLRKRAPNIVEKILFLSKVRPIDCRIWITKYIRYQYGVTQINPYI